MKKTRLFLSLIAEEHWINAIETQGYRLHAYNRFICTYHFEKIDQVSDFRPYTKLDYRDYMSVGHYQDYLSFFEESGWRPIETTRWGGTQYFQSTPQTQTEDLFSDQESKQALLKRCLNVGIGLFICFFVYFLLLSNNKLFTLEMLINPKKWYLTEGLWTMPTNLRWKAFLFETPFALLRAFTMYYFLLASVYYFLRGFVVGKEKERLNQ